MSTRITRQSGKQIALLLLAISVTAWPQATQAVQTAGPLTYNTAVHGGILDAEYRALGDRLKVKGKERVTVTGSLTDSGGTSPVTVIWENGNKASIDIPGNSSKSGKFDGQTKSGGPNALLDSIVDDLPDSLMTMLAEGSVPQLIGLGFRDPAGKSCDAYQVPYRTKANPQKGTGIKFYCFDSQTHLLRFIRYRDGQGKNAPIIEVLFDRWRQVGGQAVPGRIRRYDDSSATFTLDVASAAISARANDNVFKP